MSNSSNSLKITGPSGGEPLGEVELTPVGEVSAIVEAACKAQPEWSRRTVADRAALLEAAADLLDPQSDELSVLLASEAGTPLEQAQFEIRASIGLLRSNAREACRTAGGRVLPTEGLKGVDHDFVYTRREPLGVVAAILPFNFPVELYVEKCAAALVGGNAVVVKPPLEDPLAVMRFHKALHDAGVPSDVLSSVLGDRDVGAELSQANGIAAVSLTGSTIAGLAVAKAAAPTLRRLHLELGGNNASLVLNDADIDLAASELLRGRLLMNGQACSASKRIVVHRSLHDELAERIAAGVAKQRVGPATDPETTIGPLITAAAAERVVAQAERAISEGATAVGAAPAADGAYVSPVVLSGVPAAAAVASDDEIFGPIFNLIPVDSAAEAIEVANSSSFGLMSSVFSVDIKRAVAVAERLHSGGVVVNGTDNYRPPVIPFAGVGLSGTGREGIGYTIEELTREKTIVLRNFREPEEEL